MPIEHGPTSRHRRLAAELRRLREQTTGLAPEAAAGAIGWSRTKLVRIETATIMPSVEDVGKILATYGAPDEAIKLALVKLARDVRSGQRGWWAAYGDVLAGSYAELEDAADIIRSWQIQLVPGLLQTEDYARAIMAAGHDDPDDIDRRVQARMTRRTLLTRQNAPRLDVVLAEEVLHRPVGGPAIMADQLCALLAAGRRPNVCIRVVPTAAGQYPAIGAGAMILFEFSAAVELDTAYVETPAGSMYIEDIAQVRRCNVTFDRIASAALSVKESAALIDAVAKEYRNA
ncbi:helix-turn-helix domain-containing protein [Actinomadura parmotrematis]|uniref:Helix-turn-helix domain-containing protein n=1 Tax=Actinomadura parmotrematis TaxID=2864039 RepID=A0ABS7FSE0_9ACTN|nr:helix-turn-helix transcriptional regulator [Actinomadura parmotrematis]MBW8482880.1 helix-turn-helix domain-containing protein [Actinomadura parmotrematis]